jgi:hypothetical protein
MSKLYVNEVHSKTGSTKALEIDSSGRVTMDALPSFFATSTNTGYAALAQFDYFAGGDWWNDVRHNTGNHFTASTGTFTAPVNGVYFFSFGVLNDGALSMNIQMHKNGTAILQPYEDAGRHITFSCNIYLSANDAIRMQTLVADSFRLGSNYTWFSGCLIG